MQSHFLFFSDKAQMGAEIVAIDAPIGPHRSVFTVGRDG